MSEPVLNKNRIDENGYSHGYWEIYYWDDKLFSKGNYVNGELNGYWEFYHVNGKISSKQYYL